MEEYFPKALILCEENRVGSESAIESLPLRISQGAKLEWLEIVCSPDAYAMTVWHQAFANAILRYAEVHNCFEIHSIFELKFKTLRVLNKLQDVHLQDVGRLRDNFFIYGRIRNKGEDDHFRIINQYQLPLATYNFSCKEE